MYIAKIDNSKKNVTFNAGYPILNKLNPISYYGDRYLAKSAKMSQSMVDDFTPELNSMLQVVPLKIGKNLNISAIDINPNKSQNYVFFLHGMAQNVKSYRALYEEILGHNVGVFAVEYRGYGINKSAIISEDKLLKDVEVAYDYLTTKKGIKPENVVVIGHSMGGALATRFSAKHKDVKSLVLVSPVVNYYDLGPKFMASELLGQGIPERISKLTKRVPVLSWLYRQRFNTMKHIEKVKTPIYYLQSANDSVTPLKEASDLAKKVGRQGNLKEFITFPSGGHKVNSDKVSVISNILSDLGF